MQMKGEKIIELELSIDESVDAALEINHAQGFDSGSSLAKIVEQCAIKNRVQYIHCR
jgi:hypothetical protein